MPTRYIGNPVFEPQGDSEAYDYGKIFCQVLKFADNDYRCWYLAVEDNVEVKRRPAYATSTDGITWTKPNLGLISFGGNSNNNLLLDTLNRFSGLTYDAPNSRYLMMLEYTQSVADYGIHIWSATDGINFTLLKTVQTATGFGASLEGKALVQRADGRWIAYYATGHSADLRNVGAYVSDTTDITGTWTHVGPILVNNGSTSQRYGIGVQKFGSLYLGFVMVYNSTTAQTRIDLYRSEDGLYWSLVEANWLSLGTGGAWDDELVFNGHSLVQVGSDWRFYYVGAPEDHDAPSPRVAQIGYATVTQAELNSYLESDMALADNLAAYYSLEDVNAAFGGLNLTNNNAATFAAGKVGNAVNLVAASSQYLSHADNAVFDMGDIDFTILCWARLATKPGASMAILSKFVATGNQRSYQLLWQQSTDRFFFSISLDGTTTAVSVLANNFGAPSTGVWYFLAARHDAANNLMSISVNAGTPNTAAVTGGAFASTAPFEIGRSNATSLWNGLVDELLIAKRLLSDVEISDIYNGGNGRDYPYIVGAGNAFVMGSEELSAVFGGRLVR